MTAVRFRSIGHNSLFGLLVVLVVSAAVAPWASAKSPTASCTSYKGGAAGVVETFTHIKASGVSCKRAHEVLGTFANSAPGGTDLGFRCHARETKAKNTFSVRCTDGTKKITATEKEKL